MSSRIDVGALCLFVSSFSALPNLRADFTTHESPERRPNTSGNSAHPATDNRTRRRAAVRSTPNGSLPAPEHLS